MSLTTTSVAVVMFAPAAAGRASALKARVESATTLFSASELVTDKPVLAVTLSFPTYGLIRSVDIVWEIDLITLACPRVTGEELERASGRLTIAFEFISSSASI